MQFAYSPFLVLSQSSCASRKHSAFPFCWRRTAKVVLCNSWGWRSLSAKLCVCKPYKALRLQVLVSQHVKRQCVSNILLLMGCSHLIFVKYRSLSILVWGLSICRHILMNKNDLNQTEAESMRLFFNLMAFL